MNNIPNVRCHNITVVWVRMSQDVLNQVVAVLVACDCDIVSASLLVRGRMQPTVDQWNARTISTTFTDTLKIALQEF